MPEPPDSDSPGNEPLPPAQPELDEPPRDSQDTRPLKAAHARPEQAPEKPGGEGERPRAAMLREAPAEGGAPPPKLPSPLEETGRVRLVPRPEHVVPWRVILQTVRPRKTTIGLNVWQMLVVGRADPRSKQDPDLDMSPHGAEMQGVSRQHAALIPGADGLYLADLESTNGTWINGKYLGPGQRYALTPGDVIDLGLLRLEVRSVTPLGRGVEGEAG